MSQVLIFLSLLVGGLFLYGAPSGPDSLMPGRAIVGDFFLFLAFALSAFSWGRIFLKKGEAAAALALGVLFYCFLAALLGHLGALQSFPLALGFLAAAPLFLWRDRFLLPVVSLPSVPYLITALLFLVLAARTFYLDGMPDPFWYHLTSARLFSDAGRIYLPEHFPIAFHSGLWEYLFLWGNYFLAGPDGGGLIAGQYWGQWVHFFLGFLLSFFAFRALLKRLAPPVPMAWFACFLCLPFFSRELMEMATLAKNDWGAIAFGLWAAVFALGNRPVLAGLFAGAAFSAKYTLAFALLGFCFLPLPLSRVFIRNFLLAAVLAAAPILGRNFFFTGNPVFPAANGIFQSPWLGPSWDSLTAFSGQGAHLGREKIPMFFEWLRQSPLHFILLPALLLTPIFGKKYWRLAALTALPLVLFFVFTGARSEPRFLGPSLLFGIFYACLMLHTLGRRFFPAHSERSLFPLILFLLALPALRLPSLAPLFKKIPAEEIRSHLGGQASAWLRMNASPGEVATAGETRLYYLLPLRAIRVWDDPQLDRALHREMSALGLFRVLDEAGIKYLLLTEALLDVCYDLDRWTLLAKASARFPQAVPFQTLDSRVVDVKKMRAIFEKL